MNISNETLDILRNFSSINSGLTVKEGNELKTVSAMKNIYAKAIVSENFEKEHLHVNVLSNYEHLIEQAVETSYLNKDEASTLRSWRQDPANWSPK